MSPWTFTREHCVWNLRYQGCQVYAVQHEILAFYAGDLADIFLEIIRLMRHRYPFMSLTLYPRVFTDGWEANMEGVKEQP